MSQEIAFLPHFHWALVCCYADCAATASEVIGESIHSSVEELRQQGNWHALYSYFRCSIRLMEALFQLMYHGLFDFDNLGHEFIWRGRRYSRRTGSEEQAPEGPFPMFQHLEQMDQYSPHSCEEEALLSKAKKGQAEKAAHHCATSATFLAPPIEELWSDSTFFASIPALSWSDDVMLFM